MVKFLPNDISRVFVYNRFEDEYLEVPVIDKYQEYAQGLSLWKHRVVRKAVIEERDEVDVVALGRAKRQIRSIIEAGPKSSLKSRRKLARWLTNGEPTRKLNGGIIPGPGAQKEAAPDSPHVPPPPTPEPPTPATLPQLPLDISDEGWGIIVSPKNT